MNVTTTTIQNTIRSLGEHWRSFHLHPCAQCGCPSWQQPCPVCAFYPYGSKGYAEGARVRKTKPPTFKRFKRWHDAHGNIFEAVLAQVRSPIPEGQASVAPQVTRARAETEGWTWPTAQELWDTFGPNSTQESRPTATHLSVQHENVSCPVEGCKGHGAAGVPCLEWQPSISFGGYGGSWRRPSNGGHQERFRAAYDVRRLELRPSE